MDGVTMGTNYFIRNTRTGEEAHIAKTSHGYRPLFDGSWGIKSLKTLECFADDLEEIIFDEYGNEYTWPEFVERVVNSNPDGKRHRSKKSFEIITDPQGHQFAKREFS